MELVRLPILLLLVLLSYIFAIYVNAGAVYMCNGKQTSHVTVRDAGAQLTEGCVHEGNGITFDIIAMYDAGRKTPKDPVVIEISQAAFINSYIKLINGLTGDIKDEVPLLFTMSYSNMSGNSKLVFGSRSLPFKLPPHSRLRIIHSELIISSSANVEVFTFYGLQLVTNSSMEIAHNVITVEFIGRSHRSEMLVFYITGSAWMTVLDGSSFTLLDNDVTMNGHSRTNVNQWLWYQGFTSPLMISDNSAFSWVSNNISMVAYNSNGLKQYVWYQYSDSLLTISQTSNYTWLMNTISMEGYDASSIYQHVWHTSSSITISAHSQLIIASNWILLLARNYTSFLSYIMAIMSPKKTSVTGAVLGGSRMIWKGNCVGMGHNETDKRYVFGGNWSIVDGSELLLDGNNFTTTDKYEQSGSELTDFVWDPTGDADITITDGTLSIRNTKVHANSGVSDSKVWSNTSVTSKTSGKLPSMDWSTSTDNDSNGSLNSSNLQQYMCPIPNTPTTDIILIPWPSNNPSNPDSTDNGKGKSATAISSTIPSVLITSVVFLYLYNW